MVEGRASCPRRRGVDGLSIGVAIASGTFKGVFGHGVLSALEAAGWHADAYSCASSSVLSGACAATGTASTVGEEYWVDSLHHSQSDGVGMSEVVLRSIDRYGPMLREGLFSGAASQLVIAASRVAMAEAAAVTQGPDAGRLGRKLLIAALRGNGEWPAEHLVKTLFDTAKGPGCQKLTAENFDAVAYASTRMLHAWERPAWVGDVPFVDASYTCACPAIELLELGSRTVIAIAAEPGPLYRDLFRSEEIRDGSTDLGRLYIVRPATDLKTVGVDYTTATESGLRARVLPRDGGGTIVRPNPPQPLRWRFSGWLTRLPPVMHLWHGSHRRRGGSPR